MRVAAVQLDVALGDAAANVAACEALARDAARDGAEAIAPPELLATGAAFLPEVARGALPPDGVATRMLVRVAHEEGVLTGGSFLCRDRDGHVRNADLLAGPGGLLGRHDKDRPTMWENALYVGGSDDGVIAAGGPATGATVCWELMRTATARVVARRSSPRDPVPDRFWLHRRGAIPAVAWTTQRLADRRWYARHVRERPQSATPARP
jgi:predicted amidohydrolase